MRFKIQTLVDASLEQVWEGFTSELFLKLNPPFPKVKLIRFEGCLQNDRIQIELNFIFFRQNWESLITEQKREEELIYFVDEGKQLPFFLRFWKHKHLLFKKQGKTLIVDDIEFRSPFQLTDYLLLPLIYLQFLYRKPIYKRFFSSNHRKISIFHLIF